MAGSIPDVMPQTMYMDIMKHLQGRNLKIVVDATRDLLVNIRFHQFYSNNHELGEIFASEKKLEIRGPESAYFDGGKLVAEESV